MKKCPRRSCGVINNDEAVFCRACGRPLKNHSGFAIFVSVLLIIALMVSFGIAMNYRGVGRDVRATIYLSSVIISIVYLLFVKADGNSIKLLVRTSITMSVIGFAFACMHSLATNQDNFEAGATTIISLIIELFIYLKMKGISK